jgi:hypothetical protein
VTNDLCFFLSMWSTFISKGKIQVNIQGCHDGDISVLLGFNIPLNCLVSDKVSTKIVGKACTSWLLSGVVLGGRMVTPVSLRVNAFMPVSLVP